MFSNALRINYVDAECPCKHCKVRKANCHSVCKAYKKYRSDLDKGKTKLEKERYLKDIGRTEPTRKKR